MKKSVKAELTSSNLVAAIITIVTFVVLFMGTLVVLEFFQDNTGKEICHDSIILRAGANKKAVVSIGEVIPLKCKTEKICINGGDDCSEEFGKERKDNPITEVDGRDREDILEGIANAIYDCHKILGEGNLNFMPHKSRREVYGLICSKIVFSDESKKVLSESGGDISFLELYTKMSKMATRDQDVSYLESLYGIKGSERMNSFLSAKFLEWKTTITEAGREDDFNNFDSMTVSDWRIDSEIPWAVVGQIAPEGTWKSWAKSGIIGTLAAGAIGAGIIFAIPTGGSSIVASLGIVAGISGGVAGGATIGGITLLKTSPDGEFEYLSPTLYPYDLEVLRSLEIYEFVFAP